jgi:hypothetical protein
VHNLPFRFCIKYSACSAHLSHVPEHAFVLQLIP